MTDDLLTRAQAAAEAEDSAAAEAQEEQRRRELDKLIGDADDRLETLLEIPDGHDGWTWEPVYTDGGKIRAVVTTVDGVDLLARRAPDAGFRIEVYPAVWVRDGDGNALPITAPAPIDALEELPDALAAADRAAEAWTWPDDGTDDVEDDAPASDMSPGELLAAAIRRDDYTAAMAWAPVVQALATVDLTETVDRRAREIVVRLEELRAALRQP